MFTPADNTTWYPLISCLLFPDELAEQVVLILPGSWSPKICQNLCILTDWRQPSLRNVLSQVDSRLKLMFVCPLDTLIFSEFGVHKDRTPLIVHKIISS